MIDLSGYWHPRVVMPVFTSSISIRRAAPLASTLLSAGLALSSLGCGPGPAVEDKDGSATRVGKVCETWGAHAVSEDGEVSFCGYGGGANAGDEPDGQSAELTWGDWIPMPECFPDEDYDCDTCVLDGHTPVMLAEDCAEPEWDGGEGGTPLVLVFDDATVDLQPAAAATFDLQDASNCMTTDWPTAATPWLALDRDGDGEIAGGSELFGSGTELADGRLATHGFEALAELDADGDGRITHSDPRFGELVLWGDADADRVSTLTEMPSAATMGVISISLSYDVDPTCDARGNCEVEKASFVYLDRGGELRTGKVVDLHLSCH